MNDIAQALTELAQLHSKYLVNLDGMASGYANPTTPGVGTVPFDTVRRPWLDPPEGSFSFDQQNVANLPAVAGSAVVVTLIVPTGFDGVINAFSWNFTGGGFVQGSGDLQVVIARDGAAVRNYDNILVEKGTIGIARPISPIRIYSKQVVTLTINHLANALLNGNVIGSFVGYYYPQKN